MSARTRVAYLLTALAPLLAWVGFLFTVSGELSMGRSSHDLEHNLYIRMHRMAASLPPEQRPARRPPGQETASIAEYVRFAARHPGAAAAHSARDVLTLAFKSGVERFLLHYLDLSPEQRTGLPAWRGRMEREGAFAALAAVYRSNAMLVVAALVGAGLFASLVILAALGAAGSLRRGSRREAAYGASMLRRSAVIG